MASVWIHYAKAVKEFGWKRLYEKCTAMGTVKIGKLVGQDHFGNKYYEDTNEMYGQHRWVEYKDIWNYDGSMVPPSWQGWLTHQFDEPGLESEPYLEKRKKDRMELDTSDDGIYDTHVGLTNYQQELQTNQSQFRQRGYGIGALHHDAGAPDKYYKQPGSAASDEDMSYKHRKGIEWWSPDTPRHEDTKVRPVRDLDALDH